MRQSTHRLARILGMQDVILSGGLTFGITGNDTPYSGPARDIAAGSHAGPSVSGTPPLSAVPEKFLEFSGDTKNVPSEPPKPTPEELARINRWPPAPGTLVPPMKGR